jgi:hypothetical protein
VAAAVLWGCGGPFLCWGELERAGDGWRAVGTLLGPERTGIEGSREVPFLRVLSGAIPVSASAGLSGVGGIDWVWLPVVV